MLETYLFELFEQQKLFHLDFFNYYFVQCWMLEHFQERKNKIKENVYGKCCCKGIGTNVTSCVRTEQMYTDKQPPPTIVTGK